MVEILPRQHSSLWALELARHDRQEGGEDAAPPETRRSTLPLQFGDARVGGKSQAIEAQAEFGKLADGVDAG